MTDDETREAQSLRLAIVEAQSNLESLYDNRAQTWATWLKEGISSTAIAKASGVSRAAVMRSIEVWEKGRNHQWQT